MLLCSRFKDHYLTCADPENSLRGPPYRPGWFQLKTRRVGKFTIAKTYFLKNLGGPDPPPPPPPHTLNSRMFNVYHFCFSAMMEHTYIHEPTEVSFHDMSDIGAENILDLSNIQRDSVSPAEPFVPSSPSIMSDGMRDPYDPPIITSVQVHTATSPSVHDPYDPPIISMRPNNVHVQEPSVDPRRLQLQHLILNKLWANAPHQHLHRFRSCVLYVELMC